MPSSPMMPPQSVLSASSTITWPWAIYAPPPTATMRRAMSRAASGETETARCKAPVEELRTADLGEALVEIEKRGRRNRFLEHRGNPALRGVPPCRLARVAHGIEAAQTGPPHVGQQGDQNMAGDDIAKLSRQSDDALAYAIGQACRWAASNDASGSPDSGSRSSKRSISTVTSGSCRTSPEPGWPPARSCRMARDRRRRRGLQRRLEIEPGIEKVGGVGTYDAQSDWNRCIREGLHVGAELLGLRQCQRVSGRGKTRANLGTAR